MGRRISFGTSFALELRVPKCLFAIHQRFSHDTHLSSHPNDPLAAAVVLAVIDTIEQQGLTQHSRVMGEYFLVGLGRLKQKHALIADVRGRGTDNRHRA